MTLGELDREIERLETETAWEDTDEVVEVEFRPPLQRVVPVRLSDDVWTALKEEAHKVGVGPSTLVRMWLIERLGEKPGKRKAS